MLGVVAVELLPEALHQEPEWLIIVGFVAGGLVFIGLDKSIDLVRAMIGGETAAPSAIYAAVTIDLFSDGLMITVLGFAFLRDASDLARYAVLAFTAGILLTAVIEEIVPQAHADIDCGSNARSPTLFLIGGFALFSLLATILGER